MQLSLLLDARKLGDGGIGNYIENLIRGIYQFARDGAGLRLTCLVRSSRLDLYKSMTTFPYVVEEAVDYGMRGLYQLGRVVNRICKEQELQLFHAPHYTLPVGLNVPVVVTVHDVIHLKHPANWHTPMFAQVLLRHAMRKAQRVITVSRASGQDVLEFFPKSEEKLRVIPNAFPSQLLETDPEAWPKLEDERFLLSVLSNDKPHKGKEELIEAWKKVKGKHPFAKLVLAGQGTQSAEVDGIMELGPVTTPQLLWLIREAVALVVPSLIEGFCLPALEARTIGTPVIARPIPALLELLGPCGFFAKDLSVEALAEMLDIFAATGKARVLPDADFFELYSGENFTLRHLKVYEEALGT